MSQVEAQQAVGAVMVVGGGIAGMQSALDLANSGYAVYLVERATAIGGIMSQLDKTFPTNDCAMWIISPKLVEVGRHLNIELVTNAEVTDVQGQSGQFTVKVHQHPRYVDTTKCTGCGECANVCPVSLPNSYDLGLSERKAAYKLYAQAIPGAFAIEKGDKAPCRLACPAGLNVQGYVQMVRQGKYKEALQIIMQELPLPGVLGRICPAQCEDACRRAELDAPIAIRSLKRLAADQFDPRQIEIPCAPERDEKVAIIGSGPAGLSCAYHLAKKGVKSTIFEASSQTGGMLRLGIPAHRLPREILDQEIEVITNLGVKIRTNTTFGRDISLDELWSQGYHSVYLATGAHKGMNLGIPGEKSDGVRQGVDFLREVNLQGQAPVGRHVVVVGGGNVAVDVSRAAKRLGAEKVTILYRRSCDEMPALPEEVEGAQCEGIEFEYLAAPQEITAQEGKVSGVRCIRMELGELDYSGRRRPVTIPDSEFDLDCDQVIPAIGQQPDVSPFDQIEELSFTRWGTVDTDPITFATDCKGVFAGGDLQTGPWVAIRAVAAGREAAESISRYLDGLDMTQGREALPTKETPDWCPLPEGQPPVSRVEIPELDTEERTCTFKEVELGLDEEAGRAEAERCLNCGYCCECYQCVEACLADAIDHSQQPKDLELDVGSIILCPGNQVFEPAKLEEFYHHTSHPNVLTSMEFERILSASGPTMGHLVRPSDHKKPTRIAWLQCVGSRDTNHCGNPYCSAMCCMYAIKEAVVAKEHAGGDLDCAIFNMDIRTPGKEFEKYYNRAQDKEGVRFIKARVHTVDPLPGGNELALHYVTESGEIIEETFDLVILSVGIEASPQSQDLADRLGIELNSSRFVQSLPFDPVSTSVPGIYACGIFQDPKDIPSSVVDASAAACAAGRMLAPARHTQTKELDLPTEMDVQGQEPRIGVFVCNCGTNIGGVADVPSIVEYAKNLPGVVYVEENQFTCSQDTQEKIVQTIRDQKLNRVVVGACTPKTHEALFQETIRGCGLNPYLFTMANIRNQCTWVHSNHPKRATAKAKDMVHMAVAKAFRLEPIQDITVDIVKSALVVGGGLAGITSALSLADQGFPVTLVEKNQELGGVARDIQHTWQGFDVPQALSTYLERVANHPQIEVLTGSEIENSGGYVGNFQTRISTPQGPKDIDHGVTVLATGGKAADTEDYLYGKSDRVSKWHELEQKEEALDAAHCVAFIQCVGSRDKNRPYCSQICCGTSLTQAIGIKEKDPKKQVVIIYRDIRTPGQKELLYQKARQLGVIFIRYDLEHKPEVRETDQGLEIEVFDPILQQNVIIEADLLNLATAIEPISTRDLASIFKLSVDDEQFFMEAHAKLRPVDFALDGIFVCGLAHYPKDIEASIAQAQAAASRAMTLLSQSQVKISPLVSQIDQSKCIGCGLCVELCPFGAIRSEEIEEGVTRAVNIPASCKGCGLCAASCPQHAIDMLYFQNTQIEASLEAAV